MPAMMCAINNEGYGRMASAQKSVLNHAPNGKGLVQHRGSEACKLGPPLHLRPLVLLVVVLNAGAY